VLFQPIRDNDSQHLIVHELHTRKILAEIRECSGLTGWQPELGKKYEAPLIGSQDVLKVLYTPNPGHIIIKIMYVGLLCDSSQTASFS
jgi:hypothetical protein